MAIERPKYAVELSEKPFEVREYTPTIVATVHIDGDRSNAVNAGFRILANFIFGNNQAQQKIAMTAPVQQQTAMNSGSDICFTMPANYTLSTLPKPHDGRVTVIEVPRRKMAAITVSGFWSDGNFQSHRDELFAFLKKHRLTAVLSPIYAYYDAPWTPWFLRTNEVLVEVSEDLSGKIG